MSNDLTFRDAYARRIIGQIIFPTDLPFPLPPDKDSRREPMSEKDFADGLDKFGEAFSMLKIDSAPEPELSFTQEALPPLRPQDRDCRCRRGGSVRSGMILESLGLSFEIIEGSDRVGGRLYTRKLNGGGAGENSYYVRTFASSVDVFS